MTPRSYDVWLLDLDGTLVDTEWAYRREIFDRVGDRLGHTFTDADVDRVWYGMGGSRDSRLSRLGIDPATFWTTFDRLEDPETRAAATYLHDDASFVADLDVPVGVVTHAQPPLVDAVLDDLDVGDWFDAVVSCSDDLGWKPDPMPVQRAIAALDVDARSARGVLAGDGANDVGAAWNAGLDGIHVERHGPDRRGHCVLGDYRVRSFEELWNQTAAD
ncbi:MAG: HAD family hydrolase [Halanaeroarchaeum sp.]